MNSNETLIALFKEQLENESSSLATQHSLTKRGDHLIWWYFLKMVGLNPVEIEGVVCDGGGDLGIDAIWIDQDDYVHIYQFKNPQEITSAYSAGEIDKVLSGLHVILARGHDTIANPELRARIEEIYQGVRNGYRLHLVTSGSGFSNPEPTEKLNAFVSQMKGPSDTFFTWQLEDIGFIQDSFYRKTLPTVETPIDINLDQNPYQVRAADH